MKIQIETVKTASFTMDYFKFGHGKETLVILPGLSVQSVMIFADMVAESFGRSRQVCDEWGSASLYNTCREFERF